MVLATLMYENGFTIAVAHCNYQLRGEDSDLDEKLVSDWCAERQIPFHSRKVSTQKLVDETNDSIQMVARKARYSFFAELKAEHGYATTAIAHNLDDRIESVLMNVLRGTGFRGLQGMPSKRNGLIRPLIAISKQEIRAYANERRVPCRYDASNSETYYVRNWVRLRLIPMLEQIEPDALIKLQKLTERAEKELPDYNRWVDKQLSYLSSEGGLSVKELKESPVPFTLLREFLGPKGFSTEQVFEVLEILDSDSGKEVSNATHRVVKDRDQLIVAENSESEIPPSLTYELIHREELDSLKVPKNVALIDANLVGLKNDLSVTNLQFELRKWKNGDRFKPLGMRGWKKLSDFFVDEKLSIVEKDHVRLLTYSDEIVWVVGMRIDDRFKVSDSTEFVLRITI